jgi:hypothetical protein
MADYRVEATVRQDGSLVVRGLPFRPGEKVEVVVLGRRKKEGAERYPLRGRPVRYVAPFESVAGDEWGALQ